MLDDRSNNTSDVNIPDAATPGPDDVSGWLFDIREPWRIEWEGMPEFSMEDLTPLRSIIVHFESEGDIAKFEALIGQSIGKNLRSVWYPEAEITRLADKRYAIE